MRLKGIQFGLSDRQIKNRLGYFGNGLTWSPMAIAIEPKYVAKFRNREKFWEFRHRPLPLHKNILMYATAPTCALVGALRFSAVFGGNAELVLEAIRKTSCKAWAPIGVTRKWLDDYAARGPVFAHLSPVSFWYVDAVKVGLDDARGLHLGDVPRGVGQAKVSFRDKQAVEAFFSRKDEVASAFE